MKLKNKGLTLIVLSSFLLLASLSIIATAEAAGYDLYLPAVTNGATRALSAPVLWAMDYPYCDIGPTGGDAAAAAAAACVLAAVWAILNGVPIGISPISSSGGGGTGGDLAKSSSYDFSNIPLPPEDPPAHGIMIACDGDGPFEAILAAFVKGRGIKVTPGSGRDTPVIFGSGGELLPGLTVKSGEDETEQLAEKRELWGQVKREIPAELGIKLLQSIRRLDKSKTLLFSRQDVCDVSGVADALWDKIWYDLIDAIKFLRVYKSNEVMKKAVREFIEIHGRRPGDDSHDILKLDHIYNRLKAEEGK